MGSCSENLKTIDKSGRLLLGLVLDRVSTCHVVLPLEACEEKRTDGTRRIFTTRRIPSARRTKRLCVDARMRQS